MLTDCTAPLHEVAAALGRKPGWLRRSWRKLVAERGFPRPLPGSSFVWSRKLVELWIATGGLAGPTRPANDDDPPPPATDPAAGLIAAQRRNLAERYAGRS